MPPKMIVEGQEQVQKKRQVKKQGQGNQSKRVRTSSPERGTQVKTDHIQGQQERNTNQDERLASNPNQEKERSGSISQEVREDLKINVENNMTGQGQPEQVKEDINLQTDKQVKDADLQSLPEEDKKRSKCVN